MRPGRRKIALAPHDRTVTSMSAVLEYPQRHAVSAQEYLRMGEGGVFAPEVRLELIEGEIGRFRSPTWFCSERVRTVIRDLIRRPRTYCFTLKGDESVTALALPAIVVSAAALFAA